jgi:uncharacterized membrane protein YkvA (DUF1232 family)
MLKDILSKITSGRANTAPDLVMRVKLIFRLMGDRRVSPFLKILPIAAVIYLIVPFDFTLGPLDDAAVLGLAAYLFVELAPDAVVEEHLGRIWRAREMRGRHETSGGDVVDGTIVNGNEKGTKAPPQLTEGKKKKTKKRA